MKETMALKNEVLPAWLTTAFQALPTNPEALWDTYRHQQFEQLRQRGLPSRREAAWKYTDLAFLGQRSWAFPEITTPSLSESLQALLAERAREQDLLVFVNGRYAPQLSALSALPAGVIVSNLQQALTTHATLLRTYLLKDIDTQGHPFASLNAALSSDGLFLYVPPSVILERPLHLLSLSLNGEGFMAHPRHVVILEKDTQLSLTEEYRSENANGYLTTVAVDFFVGRNAVLNYYKLQDEAADAQHFAQLFFHQQQQSSVNACSFSLGGQFTRNEWTVTLQEEAAACRIKGFYGLNADGQVMDTPIHIEHAAPQTQSTIDYRGVLGRQSRAIFKGQVRVQPAAQKTKAEQMNHNLLLSPLAEINTQPELEIYADEVQCRHGATTGQLDEESLFYLCARGLDPLTAKALLLQAFVEAVLNEVTLPSVSEAMRELWRKQVIAL